MSSFVSGLILAMGHPLSPSIFAGNHAPAIQQGHIGLVVRSRLAYQVPVDTHGGLFPASRDLL
jgi:hypothetical protein